MYHATKELQHAQKEKVAKAEKRKLPEEDSMWWNHPVRHDEWWYYDEKAHQRDQVRPSETE